MVSNQFRRMDLGNVNCVVLPLVFGDFIFLKHVQTVFLMEESVSMAKGPENPEIKSYIYSF